MNKENERYSLLTQDIRLLTECCNNLKINVGADIEDGIKSLLNNEILIKLHEQNAVLKGVLKEFKKDRPQVIPIK